MRGKADADAAHDSMCEKEKLIRREISFCRRFIETEPISGAKRKNALV